jgi:hypothetical protein
MAARFTRQEILSELDEAARDFKFPGLDNGFIYPVDTRLHAFRDEARWALVIEVVGYDYRGHSLDDVVYVLGNCIDLPFADNVLARIDTIDGLEDEEEPVVAAGAEWVELRGKVVPVPRPAGTDLVEVFRALTPEFRHLLLADEDELRRLVPTDLPRILVLEEWNHPDVFDGALPSQSDTFLRIADVLVDGRPELYTPTQPPNTHWSNWPEGGAL